jgi:hypothetical protein
VFGLVTGASLIMKSGLGTLWCILSITFEPLSQLF